MNPDKAASISVALDPETFATFQEATEIVSKAGIRVPTNQLVQVLINAEMRRLSSRKIAQRFLKSVMQQLGMLSGTNLDDEDDSAPDLRPPALASATRS